MLKLLALRFMAVVASVLFLALPVSAATFEAKGSAQEGLMVYTFTIPTTAAVNDFSKPIPSCQNMSIYWERGNSAVVSLYPADSDDDTSTEIEANTLIHQFTTNERYGVFEPSKAFVRFVVDTVNASTPSSVKVFCSNFAANSRSSAGTYLASAYNTSASETGGIAEALTACSTAATPGGFVVLPPGITTIDATNLSSPIINMPTSSTANQALCDLIGYGSALPSDSATNLEGGSTIRITNSASKTGIRVNSNGQVLSDFTIQMLDTNASTIAIEVASPDDSSPSCADGSCQKGELGINNYTINNVNITGPAIGGPGIGLDLTFSLKGYMVGGEIQKWDKGINYSDPADPASGAGSNADLFSAVKIRACDIGVNATNRHGPDMVTFEASTIEGNDIGAYFTGPSGTVIRRLVDHSGHWENTTENIRLSTDASSSAEPVWFHGFGSSFHTATYDITRDYYAAGWDPDTCTGCFFNNGVNYTNFARIKSVGSNWFKENGTGGVYNTGVLTVAPSFDTCTSFYGTTGQDAQVTGDICIDRLTHMYWSCVAGSDGICNSASEWFNILGAPSITTADTGTGTAPLMVGEFNIADRPTATGDIRYSLPTAYPGLRGCFYDNGEGDGGIIVDASAGDEIILDGTKIGVADRIDSPGVAGAGANGDMICLHAIDATYWVTHSRSGTWVDGGAS